jgi:hypothetical protein
MNHIGLRMRQLGLCPLSAFLLTVCFYFPGLANASSQVAGGLSTTAPSGVAVETSGCEPKFNPFDLYDSGKQSSIALHSSGLVLEFHQAQSSGGLWYRVGKQSPEDKNDIVWGNSQKVSDAYGYWPAVALSKEGFVIAVHSDLAFKTGSEQFYRVGYIDPNGDQNQSISWITDFIHWDGGFNTSIAINDNGVIIGVHESNAFSGTGLYYRIGHLSYVDYSIAWNSGSTGVNYDDGINPNIAINNHNEVVEVHQVTNESLLHYRRGTVSEGKINFAESQRYENYAKEPAVALLDSGLVLEVHVGWVGRDTGGGVYSRTGKLDPSNSTLIEWSPSVKSDDNIDVAYPALATNGRYALQTHVKGDAFGISTKIYYSGAEIQCPNL